MRERENGGRERENVPRIFEERERDVAIKQPRIFGMRQTERETDKERHTHAHRGMQ